MPQSHREKRRRRRVRTRRAAWINIEGNAKPIRCVLWDVSEDGARLAPAQVGKLPDVFTLILDKTTAHRCRVMWRKDAQLGVRFLRGGDEENAASAKPQIAQPPRDLPAGLHSPVGIYALDGAEVPGGPSVSFFAAGFVVVLIALTALFYFAGQQSELGSAWALNVCQEADSLCRHPEFPGGASVLMVLVYFAARGMEA
jgi:hypothetical protein